MVKPLLKAAEEGDLDGVNAAITAGANVEARQFGKTPLHLACRGVHTAVAVALIENHGANPKAGDVVRPWGGGGWYVQVG